MPLISDIMRTISDDICMFITQRQI